MKWRTPIFIVSILLLLLDAYQFIRIETFFAGKHPISTATGNLYLNQYMGGRHGTILTLVSNTNSIQLSCATAGISIVATCIYDKKGDMPLGAASATWIDTPVELFAKTQHHPLSIELQGGVAQYKWTVQQIYDRQMQQLRTEFLIPLALLAICTLSLAFRRRHLKQGGI